MTKRFQQSDIRQHIRLILQKPNRATRRREAMIFTRDLLGGCCTDPKETMKQMLKLWTKLGGLR